MERSFSPVEHYPYKWRELREIKAISDSDILPVSDGGVEVHTLQHMWDFMEQELNSAFITTYGDKNGADEYACSRWEKMLGLIPSNEASLSDRQFAIYIRLFQMTPYTLENIKKNLASILGENKTIILPDVETQEVKVVMSLDSRFKIDAIKELMDAITPANMKLIMDIDHTTYQDLEDETHNELAEYTHEEIPVTSSLQD